MNNEELWRQINKIVSYFKLASGNSEDFTEEDWKSFALELYKSARLNRLNAQLDAILGEGSVQKRSS